MALPDDVPRADASVALHMDGPDDEPLEIDIDVRVACPCGNAETKRCQAYALRDTETVMCMACGATFDVTFAARVAFAVESVRQASSSVLDQRDQTGPRSQSR